MLWAALSQMFPPKRSHLENFNGEPSEVLIKEPALNILTTENIVFVYRRGVRM